MNDVTLAMPLKKPNSYQNEIHKPLQSIASFNFPSYAKTWLLFPKLNKKIFSL